MRRKIAAIAVLVLTVLLCLCGCVNVGKNRGRKINSVNHRGYYDAPENTLAAFRRSAEMGFTFVECDVRFTKDARAVLIHNSTVDKTSDGSGKISDLTFEDVRKLDFGSWKNKKYAGEKIPSFEEFVSLCLELGLHPYVEIKGRPSDELVEFLVKTVNDSKLDVTWIAFDYYVVRYLSELCPDGRIGWLLTVVSEGKVNTLLKLKTENNRLFVDCAYQNLTLDVINYCKSKKVPIEVYTLDDERIIANIDPYISGVTSNKINAQNFFETL
ncbi:MAG: hypothetical protein NC132_01095 [Corallococcus sp.]|nr:hypothetical protein [Corallococcus sp.]MCM1359485.1 hypothetical protein [Corallococcus sp.]MCM1394703.1 hypothetical protein [Corallococcus sp.]